MARAHFSGVPLWRRSRTAQPGDLKVCPVCGALNAELAEECFVCSWHGAFERDPELLERQLDDLLKRCPEFSDLVAERPYLRPRLPWWRRLLGFWRLGRIDVRV